MGLDDFVSSEGWLNKPKDRHGAKCKKLRDIGKEVGKKDKNRKVLLFVDNSSVHVSAPSDDLRYATVVLSPKNTTSHTAASGYRNNATGVPFKPTLLHCQQAGG